jgi:phosphate starvation-inducible PhoH-like protein
MMRCLTCSALRIFKSSRERGNIEVAPLAYMRGRTLDDSFIILDEAQTPPPSR